MWHGMVYILYILKGFVTENFRVFISIDVHYTHKHVFVEGLHDINLKRLFFPCK